MKLRVIKGDVPGTILNLDKDSFSIGRVEDNDFVINDPGVSRHHCRFSKIDGEWLVEDMQSVNGILVNGKKVEGGILLHPGDEITVFSHIFVIETDDAAAKPIPKESDNESMRAPGNDYEVGYHSNEEPRQSGGTIIAIKIAVLVVIIAAIITLLMMLMGDNKQKTPTDNSENVAEAVAEESAAEASERVARGETMLPKDGKGNVAQPAPETAPPPPPVIQQQMNTDSETSQQADASSRSRSRKSDASRRKREEGNGGTAIAVVTSPEGAEVSIDGHSKGISPLVIDDLEDGQYSLEITKPGYERLVRMINVPGDFSSQPIVLVQKVGTLVVRSEPEGATVREGRQIFGVTPLLIEPFREGQHELLIERAGYEPQKANVTMTASRGEQLYISLSKALGGIDVVTTPPGCDVYIDGVLMGKTPLETDSMESKPLCLRNLLPGQCTLRIVHPGTTMFDNSTIMIKKDAVTPVRSFMWIPTHKLTLLNGKTVIGMLLRQTGDGVDLLNSANKRESYIKQEYTECVELSKAEQTAALKNRVALREASGENTGGKSVLSVSFAEFMQRSRFPNFKQNYKGKRICITGDVTMRMKNPKGEMIVQFGNKQMRCVMASTVPEEDFKKIGEMDKQNQQVSLRGEYTGEDKEGIHLMRNCVLLAMPD